MSFWETNTHGEVQDGLSLTELAPGAEGTEENRKGMSLSP